LSPILVRPVREQLEHDRVIRLLQAKYKRKFEVAINPGNEQTAPVTIGTSPSPWFPDLVLQSTDRARKLVGTVEVETAESVNHLEAMSQWAAFGKLRVPFHLYVPATNIDTAKRMCVEMQIGVAELWAYTALGDQMRFTLVHRSAEAKPRAASAPRPVAATVPRPAAAAARPAAAVKRPAAAPKRKAAPPARPARRVAAAKKSAAPRGSAHKKNARPARTQKRK
jgi:histone H1/5